MKRSLPAMIAAALALTACTHSVQTTSGAAYLARYDEDYAPPKGGRRDLDAEIREIAAIEPSLAFPARIGLARIEDGRLRSIPAAEAAIWAATLQDLGAGYGDFVPVNPIIAGMVRPVDTLDKKRRALSPEDAVAAVRRGAARQHLDYVLIYEVGAVGQSRQNALSATDLTIVGLFVLPSRGVEVEAAASGLLIDVRTGYPYLTATGFAEDRVTARAVSVSDKRRLLTDTVQEEAVAALAAEAFEGLRTLKARAAE